jgi:DNA-binding MarR family transcriptional regulator
VDWRSSVEFHALNVKPEASTVAWHFVNGGCMPKGTKADADLALLTAVEKGEVVTQQMLKQELGVSVGLINALVKRAVMKGLVKVRQAPYKRYAYYLTPSGFVEKSRMVAEYLDYSLQLYREARDQYVEIFREIRRRGGTTGIVLVGGGDLAEIAVLVATNEEISLLGIVEPGSNVEKRFGIRVVPSLKDLGDDVEAAIVTTLGSPQETYEALLKELPSGQVFAPKILRITPNRSELLAMTNEGGI